MENLSQCPAGMYTPADVKLGGPLMYFVGSTGEVIASMDDKGNVCFRPAWDIGRQNIDEKKLMTVSRCVLMLLDRISGRTTA